MKQQIWSCVNIIHDSYKHDDVYLHNAVCLWGGHVFFERKEKREKTDIHTGQPYLCQHIAKHLYANAQKDSRYASILCLIIYLYITICKFVCSPTLLKSGAELAAKQGLTVWNSLIFVTLFDEVIFMLLH